MPLWHGQGKLNLYTTHSSSAADFNLLCRNLLQVLTRYSTANLKLSARNELPFSNWCFESVNAALHILNVIFDESVGISCWKRFNLEGLLLAVLFMGKLFLRKWMSHQQVTYYREARLAELIHFTASEVQEKHEMGGGDYFILFFQLLFSREVYIILCVDAGSLSSNQTVIHILTSRYI